MPPSRSKWISVIIPSFCVSQVSSPDPFDSRISKSVFHLVFDIPISFSGSILYPVLPLRSGGVARLTWDHKALNPYRCCPALSSSALTQGTAVWISVGSAGSFKVILYWDVWNFLMFHWHSASVFQQDWHMPDLDALVQFTPLFFPLFVLAKWVTWYSGLSCIQANLALASFQNALNRN